MSYISVDIKNIKEGLIDKIHAIGKKKSILANINRLKGISKKGIDAAKLRSVNADAVLSTKQFEAVVLGISTGGPFSLQQVIPMISEKINLPMIIVQHMPPKFTKSLANRLNSISKVNVKEAEDGELLQRGTVYVAPGGFHITFKKEGLGKVRVILEEEPSNSLYRPSVNIMMSAAANTWGGRTLGIIMTGMGKDGLEGAKVLKSKKGVLIAQDEESSVVWGMPRAVIDAGLTDIVAPLEKISKLINKVIR
jgi:two-component system chemotaxis response regulator CheB